MLAFSDITLIDPQFKFNIHFYIQKYRCIYVLCINITKLIDKLSIELFNKFNKFVKDIHKPFKFYMTNKFDFLAESVEQNSKKV